MAVFFFLIPLLTCPSSSAETLKSKLDAAPFKIAYESYVSNNWDLFAVSAEHPGNIDLTLPDESKWTAITTNGNSKKESAWFLPPKGTRKQP